MNHYSVRHHFDEIYFLLKVFGDEADMYKLEDVQMQDFGNVGEVNITKDDTLLMKVCISKHGKY